MVANTPGLAHTTDPHGTRSTVGRLIWCFRYMSTGKRVDFEMEFDPTDPFDEKFQDRMFNQELVLALRQLLRRGDIVIDAGAQKGYVSLHAAVLVGREGRVLSFEPDTRSREILQRNCLRNDLGQVEIFGVALGDKESTKDLKLSSQLGWSSFYPNKRNEHTTVATQRVRIERLDTIVGETVSCESLQRLAFVKIDCEGAEPEVIKGMTSLLSQANPILWVEVNTGSLDAAGSSESDLLKVLADNGYSTYRPAIEQTTCGAPALFLSPYQGLPDDLSHRVFDIVSVRPQLLAKLDTCGVRVVHS